MSKKGELVPGTNNRIVTISGALGVGGRPCWLAWCPAMLLVLVPCHRINLMPSVASSPLRLPPPSGPRLPPPLGPAAAAPGRRLTRGGRGARGAGTPESALYAHQLVQERVAARIATTL